jgi:hypothetical protein
MPTGPAGSTIVRGLFKSVRASQSAGIEFGNIQAGLMGRGAIRRATYLSLAKSARESQVDQAIHRHGKLIDGAQGRNRTTDTRIFSPLLYRLSYLGTRQKGGGIGFLEDGSDPVQPDPAGSSKVAEFL